MITSYTLSEALNLLESGDFHSVAYVSADRKQQQGGKIVRIPEARIVSHYNRDSSPKSESAKAQNHSVNATRNLHLSNGLIRKFNIYLLFAINNIPVL